MASLAKRAFWKIFFLLGNNIVINNLLVLIGKDAFIKNWLYNWTQKKVDTTKSVQENMGCSLQPAIIELVDRSHERLQELAALLKNNARVLDIGCGAGLFLKDFEKTEKSFQLYGIDMNAAYLELAKKEVKQAKYYTGNYLKLAIPEKFDLIYSISVFQYIEPSRLDVYFRKIAANLEQGGFYFMQYPHALSLKDTFYPDLSYVKYAPEQVEKIASRYLTLRRHEHFFDQRKVQRYDEKHYFFPGTAAQRLDTVENSYLLIAEKV